MEVVVGAGAGAVVAAGLWLALRATFAAPLFGRTNHRGASVPVGAGIIVALTPALPQRARAGSLRARHRPGRAPCRQRDGARGRRLRAARLHRRRGRGRRRARASAATSGAARGPAHDRRAEAASAALAVAVVVAPVRSTPTGPLRPRGRRAARRRRGQPGQPARPGARAARPRSALVLGGAAARARPGRRRWPASRWCSARRLGLLRVRPPRAADARRRRRQRRSAPPSASASCWPQPRSAVAALVVVVALNVLSERVSFSAVIDRTPPLRASSTGSARSHGGDPREVVAPSG